MVLMGLGGLSIDVMRLYDLYARAQRAAEAGALAGVLYLPCYYASTASDTTVSGCAPGASPDGTNSAVSRALNEVSRNGFGAPPASGTVPPAQACPAPVTSVEVAVCRVPGKSTDLQVTVTETTNVFLLSAVGVGPASVSATAQAEYLPPIQMGSRQSYFGDQAECSSSPSGPGACDPTKSGAGYVHLQNFLAVIDGPGDLKEFGDAYVYCEEGPSTAPPPNQGGPFTSFTGMSTNHPEYSDSPHCGVPSTSPPNAGNPDQQPTGYDGPMTRGTVHPGAHNYAITVDTPNSSVWVYNGNYIPTNVAGVPNLDHFQCTCQPKYGLPSYGLKTHDGGHFDDPYFYFNTTYTLYRVPYVYLRSNDQLVQKTTFPPYDMMTNDLSAHSCNTDGSQVYDLSKLSTYQAGGPTAGGCVAVSSISPGACFEQWCQIGVAQSTGLYRLAVETTGLTNTIQGWGAKEYAIKVCNPGTTSASIFNCPVGANTSVAAWNNMTVYYASSQASASSDLANIPATYAGRSVVVSLFDPGDSSGDVYMEIVPPAGSGVAVQYPAGIRTKTDPGNNQTAIWSSTGNDRIYNGLWINTTVNLPSSYTGGWWQMYYDVPNGTPNDTVTIAFSVIGSPVHLVKLG
jgi:hypothetical protein